MTMTRIKILAVLLILLAGIGACKKYEDGPAFSLRSKAARVANNWKIAEALDNGNNVTSDYNKYELDLTKDGHAELSIDYNFFGGNLKYTTSGTWTFVSEKEKISFDYENDQADNVYKILKLKEKEMWLKEDTGTLELHLVPR
jgi:hypothetical protein